jgi:hypothetical protein
MAAIGSMQCEKCRGFTVYKGEGKRTVRVVLTGDGTPHAYLLKLLCDKCHPNPGPLELSRKAILAQIADLPFPEPDKARTVNAR